MVGHKLGEFATDHILGDVNRDELLSVMHCNGMAHHFRSDRRSARPRLVDLLFVPGIHGEYGLHQVVVNEWTLFD